MVEILSKPDIHTHLKLEVLNFSTHQEISLRIPRQVNLTYIIFTSELFRANPIDVNQIYRRLVSGLVFLFVCFLNSDIHLPIKKIHFDMHT